MDKYQFSLCVAILLAVSPICLADTSSNASREIYSYDNFKYYRIEGTDENLNNVIAELDANISTFYQEFDYSIARQDGNLTYYTFIVPPKYQEIFEEFVDKNHVTRILLANDYAAYVKSEQAPPGSDLTWDAYYDVDSIFGFLNKTSARYRNTKVVVGGISYEGRKLLGLRIKSGAKGKPAFFIQSGSHAREWITPAVSTYFINQLLTSTDPQIIAMRDQFDWYIFPNVNPDGYQYSYTKVLTGNNDSCNYQYYHGTKPFSEPETRSLSKYIASIKNLHAYVGMFSDSGGLYIPYTAGLKIDNHDDLVQIGNVSIAYGYRVNGCEYYGPAIARAEAMEWVKRSLEVPLVFEYYLRGDLFDWPPSKIYQQGDEFTQMILGLVTEANNLNYF